MNIKLPIPKFELGYLRSLNEHLSRILHLFDKQKVGFPPIDGVNYLEDVNYVMQNGEWKSLYITDNSDANWLTVDIDENAVFGAGNVSITAGKLEVTDGANNVAATFKSTDQYAYVSFMDGTTSSADHVAVGADGDGMRILTGASTAVEISSSRNITLGGVSISKSTNDANLSIYGGTSDSANIELYGGAHATQAGNTFYDANQHTFRTGSVSPYNSNTCFAIYNTGHSAFAGPSGGYLQVNPSPTGVSQTYGIVINGRAYIGYNGTDSQVTISDNESTKPIVIRSGLADVAKFTSSSTTVYTDINIEEASPVITLTDTNASTQSAVNSLIQWEDDGTTGIAGRIGFPSAANSNFIIENRNSAGSTIIETNDTAAIIIDSDQNVECSGWIGSTDSGFHAVKTTDQAYTTIADITSWDTNAVTSSLMSWNATTGILTFDTAGKYKISMDVSTVATSGSGLGTSQVYMYLDTGSGYALVSGSTRLMHANNNGSGSSATITWIIDAAAGDDIKFRIERVSGSISLAVADASLSVHRI